MVRAGRLPFNKKAGRVPDSWLLPRFLRRNTTRIRILGLGTAAVRRRQQVGFVTSGRLG